MKANTIFNTLLVTLTAISILACNSNKNRTYDVNATVTTVDNSLEGQLSRINSQIKLFESAKQVDTNQTKEINSELSSLNLEKSKIQAQIRIKSNNEVLGRIPENLSEELVKRISEDKREIKKINSKQEENRIAFN